MTTHSTPEFNKLTDYLASSDTLSNLCNHIEKLSKLQIKLCSQLDSPLNQHVTVADYQQKTLVLHTDSPAWAAKLRFKTPDILVVLKNDLTDIQTIRIKVIPTNPATTKPPPSTKISPDTANLIRQVADNIPDTALRSVLFNIAKNSE